jgi:hypothetical protein
MAAVEHAKLHVFKGFDVGYMLNPDTLKIWPPGTKIRLDHPLGKWLGDQASSKPACSRTRRRSSSVVAGVHHGGRQNNIVPNAISQFLAAEGGELGYNAGHRFTIGRPIIATQDGERLDAILLAQLKSPDPQTRRSFWHLGIRQTMDHVWVLRVQGSTRRIVAIASTVERFSDSLRLFQTFS